MRIARESWLIAILGIVDLITTIVFIRHHGAEEANPLFHFFWVIGPIAFIIAKMIFIAVPIGILEWARSERPRFVRWASRTAIFGYMVCYGLGFAKLNGPAARAQEVNGHDYPGSISVSDFSLTPPMHGPGIVGPGMMLPPAMLPHMMLPPMRDFKQVWREDRKRRNHRWGRKPRLESEQVVLESNL